MDGGAGKRKGWERGRRVGLKGREDVGSAGSYKVAFWNVAGVKNKDGDLWKGLEEWEVVVMCETWMEESDWVYVRNRLPEGYGWRKQWAKRESKKGKTTGGMLMGVRKEVETRDEEEEEREGIMMRKVKMVVWRVVGVYVIKDLQKKLKGIEEWVEGREEGTKIVMWWGFNACTGREGEEISGDGEGEESGVETRRSKDVEGNGEGKRLCKYCDERGWGILNANIEGDEEGEWTYTGG